MPTRNVSDVQLWWSHPNYTPVQRDRVRNLAAVLAAGDSIPAGSIFRMDSGYPDIDDLTLPSLVGETFRIKEHMGIGQDRVRRTDVNVADVKEASGTFTCNYGVDDTPEQFFRAVKEDPGLNLDGRKRPMTLYAVINPIEGFVNAALGSGMLSAAAAAMDNQIAVDTIAGAAFNVGDYLKISQFANHASKRAAVNGAVAAGGEILTIDQIATGPVVVGDYFRIAGDTQAYRVIAGEVGAGGGSIAISPDLQMNAADNAILTFLTVNGSGTVHRIVSGSVAIGATGNLGINPILPVAAADNAVFTKQVREPQLDTWRDLNKSDYVIGEFDYTPETDGEVMGAFSLQGAGTGYDLVRDRTA